MTVTLWREEAMRGIVSTIVGVVTCFALAFLTGQILGPVTCRDGWASPSIGSRGACSWHGGVDRSRKGLVIVFVALGSVAGVSFYGSKWGAYLDGTSAPSFPPPQLPHSKPPPEKPFTPPEPGEEACPQCGSGMRLRKAGRGRHKGKNFWGCKRYPYCRGIRNVDP